jgi:hypothetical protein
VADDVAAVRRFAAKVPAAVPQSAADLKIKKYFSIF